MRCFRNHGAQTAMPQTFLETGEKRLLVTRFDMDHAVRRQARLRDRGSKKVGACDDPQHLSSGPRSNSGNKQRRRRPIHCPIAAAGKFMQRPQCQPSPRKPAVDVGKAERQDLAHAACTALQVRNALLKPGNNRLCRAIGHGEFGSPEGFATPQGAVMFIICSLCRNESI